jgi:hypothetical protein
MLVFEVVENCSRVLLQNLGSTKEALGVDILWASFVYCIYL